MSDEQEGDAPQQDQATGRFLTGNNGAGGRPKGARNKLSEALLADLCADWEEHGVSVIAKVREEKPESYLKVVASLSPRDLNIALPDRTLGDLLDELPDD